MQTTLNHHTLSTHAVAVMAYLTCVITPLAAQPSRSHTPPPASQVQSGDFLWPKRPGAVVLYNSKVGSAGENEKKEWLESRDEYVKSLKEQKTLSSLEKERLRALQKMSYESFLATYLADAPPSEVTQYGGHFGTGHVAIVRRKDGKVTIVEALMGKGVREIPYDDWIVERAGEWIWHGRLRDASDEQRAAIAERAALYIGRPYHFWNFDLADDTGFYCSKLAWFATREATTTILDDNSNPRRLLWYSPRQLLASPHVIILQDPGSYFR